MKNPKVSVVIPVYNEINTIEEILNRVQSVKIDKEIVIVDDFSTDGTREFLNLIVQKKQQSKTLTSSKSNSNLKIDNIRVYFNLINSGKVAALQKGFDESKGDIIIKAEIPSPRKMSPQLMERVSIIETLYVYSNFPIRIQNPDSHAGFYTYGGGFLPFSISKDPLETFTIYKVEENGQ